MDLVLSPLICVLSVGIVLLFIMALASPLEALGWWAGWSHKQLVPNASTVEKREPSQAESGSSASHYVVYLTAIGGISADDISSRERRFLALLGANLPHAVVTSDVFPFSVNNNPLNGERQLSWLWQRIHNSRMRGKLGVIATLIFVRNLFQVAVSGDSRYGPIYNVGVAREIVDSLLRHGYSTGSGRPVTVMGWSGGGQIAVGVARYIRQALGAPITIVSIGGVMAGDPGIGYVKRLYHLQGSRDSFPDIGVILYPGRWPFLKYTAWSRAEQEGRIVRIDPGPMRHTGRGDYFDRHETLPNGQTHLDTTATIVSNIIRDNTVAAEPG